MNKLKIFLLLLCTTAIVACAKKVKRDYHINDFHNFSRTFNDMNDAQLNAAHQIGISPISSRAEAEKEKGTLQEIKPCKLYAIDSLSNSVPFLVKRAANLLNTIGRNFQDSLESKNAPQYKLIITSVLRTQDDVHKLHKKNSNSIVNSAHMYATTFDVAYARYEKTENSDTNVPESKLKAVLAEVLRDLQKENKCYVRYEVKQGCFHITARPI